MCSTALSTEQTTRSIKTETDQVGVHVPSCPRWQACSGLALAAVTLLGLFAFLGHWRFDDPYITFRYASNLLAGHGLVYNVGERVLSTTAPLYAFLLAGLGFVWPDLPSLGIAVSVLCLVLGAVFLYLMPALRGQHAAGMIGAVLLCLSPDLIPTFGAETCAVVMLVLGGLLAYSRCRYTATAGLLAVAVMVRPDAVLAVVSIGIYHLATRQSIPWRALLLWASLVAIWYAGLWWYFGTPVPVTLLAKQHQGQMLISERFAPGFLSTLQSRGRLPLFWLQGVLALIGLGRVVQRARYWLPLLLWTALYFVAYTLLGVSRYFWYYGPLAPAAAVLVAEGTVAVLRSLQRLRVPRSVAMGAAGLLVIALLLPLLVQLVAVAWLDDVRVEIYTEVGQWLRTHTEPQASVGVLEAGAIGYYADRTVIDFAGLIRPEVARQLGPSITYEDSAAWAIQRYWPDYVVLHARGFTRITDSDWFGVSYHPVQSFSRDREETTVQLYARSGSN